MSLVSDWTQRNKDLQATSSDDPAPPASIPCMKSTTSFTIMITECNYLKNDLYTEEEVRRIADLRVLRRQSLKAMDWKAVGLYSKELYETTKHYGYTPWLKS